MRSWPNLATKKAFNFSMLQFSEVIWKFSTFCLESKITHVALLNLVSFFSKKLQQWSIHCLRSNQYRLPNHPTYMIQPSMPPIHNPFNNLRLFQYSHHFHRPRYHHCILGSRCSDMALHPVPLSWQLQHLHHLFVPLHTKVANKLHWNLWLFFYIKRN